LHNDFFGCGVHDHLWMANASDAVSLPLLATETVAVALVTGIFGFASGAFAAAVVTTRHERIEAFRARMIETADEFVEQLTQGLELLDNAHEHVKQLFPESVSYAGDKAEATRETVGGILADAEKTLDHVSRLIPRLYVVFRGRSVGDGGSSAERSLTAMKKSIGALQRGEPEQSSRRNLLTDETEEVSVLTEIRDHRKSFLRARDDLLIQLNAAIRRNWRP
jgi:hypothetical protein